MPTIDVKDRYRGCVLGGAIGDALGYQVEFSSMADIYRRHGPDGVTTLKPVSISRGQLAAMYSDDTQMSVAVIEGLLDAHEMPALDDDVLGVCVANHFVKWSQSPLDGHRAPGGACMSGCRRLASGVQWRVAGGARAGGCGSVMRSHPYALFAWDDLDNAVDIAVLHSGMTHRDPVALAACAAAVTGVWLALRMSNPGIIVQAMIRAAREYDESTAALLEYAKASVDNATPSFRVFDRLRGWAAHEAIAAAAYCFLARHDSYRACVVLGANTPGDSDSIAAIAGALCGAYVGLAGIPREWVDLIEKRDMLLDLADRTFAVSRAPHKLWRTLYVNHALDHAHDGTGPRGP